MGSAVGPNPAGARHAEGVILREPGQAVVARGRRGDVAPQRAANHLCPIEPDRAALTQLVE